MGLVLTGKRAMGGDGAVVPAGNSIVGDLLAVDLRDHHVGTGDSQRLILQMAEVAVAKELFERILERIWALAPDVG